MEVEARAVAAGDTVTVGGATYRLTPLEIQSLQEVQQQAFKSYKRDYLQTYSENLHLLPEAEQRAGLIEKKLEEVARWTMAEMPYVTAYSSLKCPLTPEVRQWVAEKYQDQTERSDAVLHNLLTGSLDSGLLKPDELERLSGVRPFSAKIPFDMWWVTGSREGMITFVYASTRQADSKITRQQIAAWPLGDLLNTARQVEKLTKPDVGNI